MNDEIKPVFQFLEDKASEVDEFGDQQRIGGHQRTADAIWEFISLSKQGGITIGLEGTWGSGKSTIIAMLQKKCKDSNADKEIKENLLFLFDAWAHEDDSLRRTFLCKLLTFLGKHKWLEVDEATLNEEDPQNPSDKFVNKEIAKLTRKQTTKNDYATTKFSNTGIVAALSAVFLLPNGISLINYSLDSLCFYTYCNAINWNFVIGVLLLLSPIWITWFVSIFFPDKHIGKEKPSLNNLLSSIVTKQGPTTTTTTSYGTPNPSSVEFEETFRKILNKENLKIKSEDYKLIIIFDNLDRIDPEETKKTLSTLQTFLQYKQQNQESNPFKNVWVIIPYDRKGMEKIWKNNGDLPSSMIEKRFQIRFQTPPIIFTSIRDFMIKELTIAFAGQTNQIYENVYNIFLLFANSQWKNSIPPSPPSILVNNEIAPRKIKTFINQMGTFYMQWHDEVPLTSIAFYTMLKTKYPRIDVLSKYLSGELIHYYPVAVESYLQEKYEFDLAKLYFNVEGDRAELLLIQALLLPELKEGNSNAINQFIDRYGEESILAVVEWIINFEQIHKDETTRDIYLKISKALIDSHIREKFINNHKLIETFVTGFLYEYKNKLNQENALEFISYEKIVNKIPSLYPKIAYKELSKLAFNIITQQIFAESEIINWVEGLAVLQNNLPAHFIDYVIENDIRFPFYYPPGNELVTVRNVFLVFAWSQYELIDEICYPILKIQDEDIDKLDEIFSSLLKQEAFFTNHYATLDHILHFSPAQILNAVKFSKILYGKLIDTQVIAFVQTQEVLLSSLRKHRKQEVESISTGNLAALFDIWEEISSVDDIVTSFSDRLSDANMLLAYWKHNFTEKNETSTFLGKLLFYCTVIFPGLEFQTDLGLARDGKNTIYNNIFENPMDFQQIQKGFCNSLDQFNSVDFLLRIFHSDAKTRKWIWLTLINLLKITRNLDVNNQIIEFFRENWKIAFSDFDTDFLELSTVELVKPKRNFQNLCKLDINQLTSSQIKMLQTVINNIHVAKTKKEEIVRQINKITVDTWENKYLNDEEIIKLLSAITDNMKGKKLGRNFSTGMKHYVKSIFQREKDLPSVDISLWRKAINLIQDTNVLYKKVFQNYEDNNWDIPYTEFLDYFGSFLINKYNIEKNTTVALDRLLYAPINEFSEKAIEHVNLALNEFGVENIDTLGTIAEIYSFINEMENAQESVHEETKNELFTTLIKKLRQHYPERDE